MMTLIWKPLGQTCKMQLLIRLTLVLSVMVMLYTVQVPDIKNLLVKKYNATFSDKSQVASNLAHAKKTVFLPPEIIDKIPNLFDVRQKDLEDNILSQERVKIIEEMKNYSFAPGISLKSLVPESGGQPVRALVTTTWRSGSTFIGDVLLSHPATFYHYEPFLHYGIRQVRSGPSADEAIRTIKALFHCDYSNLSAYLNYGMNHAQQFNHNYRLWDRCMEFKKSLCWSPDFMISFCNLFPFQSMKTVRLRVNLTQSLLEDKSLNVKVLLLVRDPRGTMQSRHHRDWCPGNPDCEDSKTLCADLIEDYHAAKKLSKMFPQRLKVFRYEDFSKHPYISARDMLKFFGFSFHPEVKEFLDSHTKVNVGGVSSTFRNSKTAPYHWKQQLSFEEVLLIQKNCAQAMKLWGYVPATNKSDLTNLDPVIPLNQLLS